MKYDLLLTGSEVLDPGANLCGVMDVRIAGGKIAAVAPSLPANETRKSISVKGRLVTPDLANADVSVFELRDEDIELRDSDGDAVTARRRFLPQLTLKDGRVWYERPVG